MVLRQKLSIAFLAGAFLIAVAGAQTFHAPDSPAAPPGSDDSQSSSSSWILSGTVQDPSGAVISHAIVLLRPSANRDCRLLRKTNITNIRRSKTPPVTNALWRGSSIEGILIYRTKKIPEIPEMAGYFTAHSRAPIRLLHWPGTLPGSTN